MFYLFICLLRDLPYFCISQICSHSPLNCTTAHCTATLPLSTFHSTVPQSTALLPSHSAHSTQLYHSPLHCYPPTQHIPINCTAAHCTATLPLSTFHTTVPQPTALLPSHSVHSLNCSAAHCTATLPLSTFHSTVPQPTALLTSYSAHSTQLYRSPLNCYPPNQYIPLNCTAAHCTATLPLSTFHSTVPQPTALLPSHSAHSTQL